MASVVDYLSQIQKLTNTNLQILKTLNDSFYTKKNHLFTEIDNTTYVIPSFLSLENKINALQENFENLIHSPERGEAYFNFDGNSRAIEIRKYSHAPDSVKLSPVNTFYAESNNIFKDFMTPIPYVTLELPTLPDDIVKVNVKKVVAKNNKLKEYFKYNLSYVDTWIDENGDNQSATKHKESVIYAYTNMYKTLLEYTKDVDYVEYDTIYDLPIRKNLGNATYVIESVVGDEITTELEEYITLKLRNNLTDSKYSNTLTYKRFDDTIELPLKVGDELLNFDGTGKVVITEIRNSTNTIVVKVVNGEYLNFIGTDSYDSDNDNDIHDLSKLRYYSTSNISEDKHIKVPLEEDQFVFVAVAPLNSRMNIQGGWGAGLIIDTYSLKNGDVTFKSYYEKNVKNIGDILFEMTSMVTSPVTELTESDFETISAINPKLTNADVKVVQINKHINNSTTIKNIRDAYSQKKDAELELSEIQDRINEVNNKISRTTFDNMSTTKQVFNAQLSQLNNKKSELMTVITKSTDRIYAADSSEIPSYAPKYHIRGFYVPPKFGQLSNGDEISNHIIGIQVQYRYKNTAEDIGNVVSMNVGDNNYIYSDWNIMKGFNKNKVVTCEDGVFSYDYEPSNENTNEPSYNQIDIPITRGETVDIRLRLVYDFGQPFTNVVSNWSEIINVTFPEEYVEDVTINKIIQDNNSSVDYNKFNKLLQEMGADSHINDKFVDQELTYYHKPESIASGFYTEERRVIPLKDKLQSLTDDIALIKSEIEGVDSPISIALSSNSMNTQLFPNQDNVITLTSFNELVQSLPIDLQNGNSATVGDYEILRYLDQGKNTTHTVSTIMALTISNPSNYAVKLYSIFPGSRDKSINDISNSSVSDGYVLKNGGVHYDWVNRGADESTLQRCNQFITFRVDDLWTKTPFYSIENNEFELTENCLQSGKDLPKLINGVSSMTVYPYLTNQYGMCLDNDEIRTYKLLGPQSEIIIPIKCEFKFTNSESSISEIVKYLSFDIRTSLYKDPINYNIKFVVKRDNTVEDKIFNTYKSTLFDKIMKPFNKYNVILPK